MYVRDMHMKNHGNKKDRFHAPEPQSVMREQTISLCLFDVRKSLVIPISLVEIQNQPSDANPQGELCAQLRHNRRSVYHRKNCGCIRSHRRALVPGEVGRLRRARVGA